MGTAYIPPKGNNNGEKCIKTLSEILKEEKKMKAIDKMLESENFLKTKNEIRKNIINAFRIPPNLFP
jgi:uncharacterized protein YjgD (DUF1641 family)